MSVCVCVCFICWLQVVPTIDLGRHLINDALKMVSGCIIPSSVITNSGSLSTTYIGSVLSSSHDSAEMDSGNSVTLSSTIVRHDTSHLCDLNTRAVAATLFPTSAIFNSCFNCQKTSTDAAVYQSATLTFGAGSVLIYPHKCSIIFGDFLRATAYML